MTTTTQTGFVDGYGARILAAILALLFAFALFYNYKDDFNRLMAGNSDDGLPQSSAQIAVAVNPDLKKCLEKRVGDVDQMKKDGLLNDSQYASFRSRAEQLCTQQNPAQQ